MKQPEKEQFYTDQGVKVTDRVEKGKTKFFKSRFLAEWWAAQRRSYAYEMFDAGVGSNRNFIGYGVPG